MTRGLRFRRGRLVSVIVALACVAVSAAGLRLSETAGTDDDIIRGRVGETASINEGLVTVDDVRVGTALKSNDQIRDRTTGMFVVVHVDAKATGPDKLTLQSATLLADDGLSYGTYDALAGVSAETGFAVSTDVTFEVDPARIDDLTLELYETEFISGYQQRLRIHLGIAAGNADRWRAAAKDQVLTPVDSTTRAIP